MALIEACRLAHDDDGPRLVWADAVGGERGELVVLQCDLARPEVLGAERMARERRANELLASHGAEWAGDLVELARRWEFRRGFIEAAEIDAYRFVYKTAAIFAAAPLLSSLRVTGLDEDEGPGLLHQVVTRPQFWQLSALDLVDPEIGDAAVEELLASAALPALRALGLAGVTPAAAHELVASGELAALETLRLTGQTLGEDALIAIVRAAPSLVTLELPDLSADVAATLRRMFSREICVAIGPMNLL
jgi:hypothetical protein